MSKISTTITLNDEVSRKLDVIINSLERFSKSFENIEKTFTTFARQTMQIQRNMNLSNSSLNQMANNSRGVTQNLNNTSQSAQRLADNLLEAKRNAQSIKLPSSNANILGQQTVVKPPIIGNVKTTPTISNTKLQLPKINSNQKIKIIADDTNYKRSIKTINQMMKDLTNISNEMLDGALLDSNKLLSNFVKSKAIAKDISKNNNQRQKDTPKTPSPNIKKKSNYLDNFMGSFAGNLLANVFQNGISKLQEISMQAIDTASSIIEVANVTETVFGEDLSKGQLDKWAKSTIDIFGITEIQAKKWAGTMGSILSDAIDDKGVLMKMSMDIAQLAGDIASFDNLDPEDAFFKLRSAMVGETEPLKALGINMSIASLEAFALEKGIGKTTRQMTNSEMALLRYNYLMEKTAFKQGDYNKTSQEFANRVRTMQGRFQSLAGELARGILPILSELAQVMINVMKAIEPIITFISDLIIKLMDLSKESVAVRGVLTTLGVLIGGFLVLSLMMFIGKIWESIKASQIFSLTTLRTSKVFKNFGTQLFFVVGIFVILAFALMDAHWTIKLLTVAVVICTIAFAIFNKTLMLNPIILIIGLIVMLIMWLINLWNTNEQFRIAVVTGWANLVAGIQIIVANLVLWIDLYVLMICYSWDFMVTEIALGWEWCGIQLHNIWNGIQAGTYDMCANILQSVEDMVNGCIDLINSFIGLINMIPGIDIEPLKKVTFDAIGQLRQKANDRKQEIEDRNNAFNEKAEGQRNELENKYKDKFSETFKDWGSKIDKILSDRENMIAGAGNYKPITFEGLFGGGSGQGGININDINYGLDGYDPNFAGGGLGGGKGTGGKGSGGKGKGNKLDRVDSIGKIDDPIEIDDIEILLELSRDRYRKDYSVTNDFSIVVNQADGNLNAEELVEEVATKISNQMMDSINRSMI